VIGDNGEEGEGDNSAWARSCAAAMATSVDE
jgi:hypothetical protein